MIHASQEILSLVEKAPAGDRSIYVNLDAIRELPEQYEAVLSKVTFDKDNLENDFSNVGSKTTPSYMPTPQLMYKIAEAKGICGIHDSLNESIIEEVDINPMLMKPLVDLPTYRKMVVGKRVMKQAYVIQDDGTERPSGPCTIEYNAWERCKELWSKEEAATEGYKLVTEKGGKKYYKSGQFENECKFDNEYKRKAHFDTEMKFAQVKAETKATVKYIRELAGMMTGFSKADLTAGFMIFSRVRKSSDALKMEAIMGLQAKGEKAQATLFEAPEPRNVTPSKRSRLIQAMESLVSLGGVPEDQREPVGACLNWLKGSGDDVNEKSPAPWTKAIARYSSIVAGQVGFPTPEELA